jgi:hypothetical protein
MKRLLQHGPDPSMMLHQGSSQAEMDLAELEPSYKTHSVDDSTTKRHAAPHNRSQAANDQLPSIDILASKFVGNVKVRSLFFLQLFLTRSSLKPLDFLFERCF